MRKNIGNSDQFIRFIIAFVALSLYLADVINGWTTIALFAVMMVTALLNFCPLYRVLNMSTRNRRRYDQLLVIGNFALIKK